MASVVFSDVQSRDRGIKLITGSFTWVSTTVTKTQGDGWTVAHSATGISLVTLEDGYPEIYPVSVTLQEDGAAAETAYAGAVSASAGTVAIRMVTMATGAAVDGASGQTINFCIACKNSTV